MQYASCLSGECLIYFALASWVCLHTYIFTKKPIVFSEANKTKSHEAPQRRSTRPLPAARPIPRALLHGGHADTPKSHEGPRGRLIESEEVFHSSIALPDLEQSLVTVYISPDFVRKYRLVHRLHYCC